MEFTLRRADSADLDAVMSLEEAGFPRGIVESRGAFSRRIETFPEGFLLAEHRGQPQGYICAEIWASSPDLHSDCRRFDLGHDIGAWLRRDGDTLYVASMTVAPAFRGQGLGRELFRRGLERWTREFPRVRRIFLIVNEHWTSARGIYAAEGFDKTGRLTSFFRPVDGPPGDALVMEKVTGRG